MAGGGRGPVAVGKCQGPLLSFRRKARIRNQESMCWRIDRAEQIGTVDI